MTQRFLFKSSLLYKDICPEQSRFLMFHYKAQPSAARLVDRDKLLCPLEYSVDCNGSIILFHDFISGKGIRALWRQLGNHHMHLRPNRKPAARIRRLLKRESAGKRLSAEQSVVLQKFKRASNALMATCHTCNKMSRQPGMNRELLSTLSKNRSTSGSAGKQRTPPQSASRSTPKSVVNRTPSGTPRSVSSNTSSSSSKSGSAKPSPFTRLKKILMLLCKQQSKKGCLKDFLSSL